jgi:nucleoside-diphosphate-sugar epimerase
MREAILSQTEDKPPWSMRSDLEDILAKTEVIWEELRGARLFVTGGTGFIGTWLLETLRHANEVLKLNIDVVVLTRNFSAFQRKAPDLAEYHKFKFLQGDVAGCPTPDGAVSHIIHAAAEAATNLNAPNPRRMFDTLLHGTRRTLDIAAEKQTGRYLCLSSGAVYGRQPPEMEKVDEDWTGAPNCNDPGSAYAEGKRGAETLCSIYRKQFGLNVVIARIFAVLGPLVPLGAHFAAGNFILDAVRATPVVVRGNGEAYRSYLYASDLIVWLLHILIRGVPGKAYNVGSDTPISIRDLAMLVSRLVGNGKVEILGERDTGWNPGRYVPSIDLAARELGLKETVFLAEQIRRTALWHGRTGAPVV